MADTVGESLSALQDNQASELDLRRILKEMKSNEHVRARWKRYQLLSAVVRNEDSAFQYLDISHRVSELLGTEPARKVSTWQRLLKPVASVAVAATVTMGVLTGTQLYQQTIVADDSIGQIAEVATAIPFDNALTPVAAGHFPELSVRASTGDNAQRRAHGSYNTEALFNDYVFDVSQGVRTESDVLAERQLNLYLQSHAESASFNNGNGLMPYARVGQVREH